MKTPASVLPDLPTLTRTLTRAMDGNGAAGRVKVLKRKLPRFMSTFPNEIVTCLLPDGKRKRVFVKYQGGLGHNSFGHRGDVSYEVEVYRRLLRALPDFRPRYLGAHSGGKSGDAWLLLEYVYDAARVSDLKFHRSTRQPRALTMSARWLGEFHRAHEARVRDPGLAFLKRYRADYYRGWAARTLEYAAPLEGRFPWLAALRGCGDAWFRPLLDATPTVIHGEFYAKTVLVRKGRLFMVDWESAAVAAGEIDLASLTEGKHWLGDISRRCALEYRQTRWRGSAPEEFERTLDAARIYLHFRWLGERPELAVREKNLWRYEHLYKTAARTGLL